MKFNHLTLSMRKHVSSPGFSVSCTENMSYLPLRSQKGPQLSPDPRQEPWSHTTGPDQALGGRGPAAGEQSATAEPGKGTSGLRCSRRWRHAVEVDQEGGRNAWSLKQRSSDLGYGKIYIVPKGESRVYSTLLSHGGSLGGGRLFSQKVNGMTSLDSGV